MGKRGRSKKSIFLEISRVEKQLHVKYMAFGFLKFPRKNSLLKTAHVHFFRLSKKVHIKYIANREVFLLRIGGQKLQNEKLHMCKRHQKCT